MATQADRSLPSTPDQYPSSDKFDTIVEVKVEITLEHSFYIHKGIVTFYSGYFRAALNGNFAEAGTGVLELPTEDVNTFERFVNWIYHRRHDFDALDRDLAFDGICKLWVFADIRQVPMLANAMIDALRQRIVKDQMILTTRTLFVYENTTASSTLRRFVAYVIATAGNRTWMGETRVPEKRWPADAVWDILSIVWALKAKGTTASMTKTELASLNICVEGFHDHEDGVRCSMPALRE